MHDLFSVFAGWSKVGKPSTDSQRSHVSLPPGPVNHAVQHLRGFRLTPGISPDLKFIEFTSFMYMCFLLINGNKEVTGCVKRKGVWVVSSGQPSQTEVSKTFPCANFAKHLYCLQMSEHPGILPFINSKNTFTFHFMAKHLNYCWWDGLSFFQNQNFITNRYSICISIINHVSNYDIVIVI